MPTLGNMSYWTLVKVFIIYLLLITTVSRFSAFRYPWKACTDKNIYLKIKTGNYFLVPCMLRQNTPEEVVCPKLNDQIGSSPVMCYVFVDKVLPSPIFHRILAACVAHWPIATKKKEEMQENLIFCGCCVFQLDQYHKLTLYFREYVIFVRVTRMGIKDKTPSSKLCIEVRKFITTNLRKIIGYLAQSLKFEYFVQCPEYNGVSINSLIPVSLLKENPEVRCDFHDHIIESCKVLNFWFEDQIQSRNADICRNRNLEVQDETKVSQAGNLKAEVDQTESVFVHRQLVQLAVSVGIIRTPDSNGTGFRVGPDYIMTARHVIEPIVKKVSVFQQHQMPLHIRQLDSAIVHIDFSYEWNGVPSDQNLVFSFEPEIVYENAYLDTVILKLKHDLRPYPPPFTNFFDVLESPPDRGPGYFIGHSRSDIKKTDRYQLVKLEPSDIISIKNWSMEIANEDGYLGIDNEHRILFHCSFEKGASGAPGFWINPADGRPRLELMLLCGYPTWFYDKFQGQMSGIPKSCLFEQGVSLKLIYDALKAENESLCNEIFEMRK